MPDRICAACQKAKPETEFETLYSRIGTPRLHTKCRECRNAERRESAKAWYAANAESQKQRVTEARKLRTDARKLRKAE